jgi:putative hemolysin
VIPILFDGENSLSFHLLGKIHPMLRTLRIPAEFLKKRNKTIRLEIGNVIAPEALTPFSAEELRDYLKNTTYGLRKIK